MKLYIDLETRSTIDLRTAGQYVYAAHPTTEIIVVCWALDDGPVQTWLPLDESYIPIPLLDGLTGTNKTIIAHNASFERILLSSQAGGKIGIPVVTVNQIYRWNCTAARAAAVGLPRSLEGATNALELGVGKDQAGQRLMLQMCKPKTGTGYSGVAPVWWDDPERMSRLAAYCATDVEIERELDKKLPALSPTELQVWRLTEEMNDRGILVDQHLLARMTLLIGDAECKINTDISIATAGAVPRVSDHMAVRRWLMGQGIDDVDETGVGKQAVAAMLERSDLLPLVRDVLVIRQDGGGSSSRKYKAILKRLSGDGRLRGAMVYCGAASTGRWSSRGAQLQNLPRGGTVDIEAALRDVMHNATLDEIEFLHGPPLIMASELLRPSFMAPPGHWLVRGDYSQIEARVLAWLAGQKNVVQAYAAGEDLYRVTAASIFGVSPEDATKDQRQIGKVATLALGYQGGVGAFQTMAKGYGVLVDDARAEEIKLAWRAAHYHIAQFWRELETTAADCVMRPPLLTFKVGRHGLQFRRTSQAMTLRLPSGRSLVYWNPELRRVKTHWGEWKWAVVYRAQDAMKNRWSEHHAYGGLWCENIVQATARDIMAEAMLRLRHNDFKPVLTVHDEVVAEVSNHMPANHTALAMREIMEQPPPWATGLPIAVETSAATRYIKKR